MLKADLTNARDAAIECVEAAAAVQYDCGNGRAVDAVSSLATAIRAAEEAIGPVVDCLLAAQIAGRIEQPQDAATWHEVAVRVASRTLLEAWSEIGFYRCGDQMKANSWALGMTFLLQCHTDTAAAFAASAAEESQECWRAVSARIRRDVRAEEAIKLNIRREHAAAAAADNGAPALVPLSAEQLAEKYRRDPKTFANLLGPKARQRLTPGVDYVEAADCVKGQPRYRYFETRLVLIILGLARE